MSFKKNALIKWASPRNDSTGTGKILEVQETLRGVWYVIKDDATAAQKKFRAAQLTLR